MTMSGWDGKERRGEMSDLAYAIKFLSERFENELGSTDGAHNGSVRRDIRLIQEDIKEIRKIVVGDGVHPGAMERINMFGEKLAGTIFWGRILFSVLIAGQMLGIYRMFKG